MYTVVVSPGDFVFRNHGSNPSGGTEFVAFSPRVGQGLVAAGLGRRWAGRKRSLICSLKWAAERMGLEWTRTVGSI